MATLVVKTIGTGGDYTTIADWVAAIPASLVTADEIWRGELLDQEFAVAGQVFDIAGKTADATRYIELTAAAGASLFDVRGPIRYTPTSGARIVRTSSYGYTGRVTVPYTRISRLQIANTSTGPTAGDALYVSAANCDIDRCLLSSNSSLVGDGTLYLRYATSCIRNSVVLQGGTSASYILARMYDGASAYNTAFISTGTTLTNGVQFDYQTPVLKNCYIAGATNPLSGGVTPTITSCFSDVAAAGFSVAAFSAATFVDVAPGTLDLRLAAGSALIDAGTDEATYAATDIFGGARTLGSYDVGPDEYSTGGADVTIDGVALTSTSSLVVNDFTLLSDVTIDGVSLVSTSSLVVGDFLAGVLAETIVSETATGDNGPGLMYDDAILNPGKYLAIKLLDTPVGGTFVLYDNGSILVEGFSVGNHGPYNYEVYDVTTGIALLSTDSFTFDVIAPGAETIDGITLVSNAVLSVGDMTHDEVIAGITLVSSTLLVVGGMYTGDAPPMYAKVGGVYYRVVGVFAKKTGQYSPVSALLVKTSGAYLTPQ